MCQCCLLTDDGRTNALHRIIPKMTKALTREDKVRIFQSRPGIWSKVGREARALIVQKEAQIIIGVR